MSRCHYDRAPRTAAAARRRGTCHSPALSCLALLACALLHRAAFADEQALRPNIVFIMADDLGYGDLGCYGQQQIHTPHLDRLAAEGLRFTDYYAGSTVCAPSRCVLMTGYHTGHCYIRGNNNLNLRPGDVTVAEVLRQAGYRTGMFGKWGLGQESSDGLPTRQGFDEFFGYLDQRHAHNYYPAFLIRGARRELLSNVVPGEGDFGGGVATEKNEYSHDLIFAEALRFLEASRDKPFFLYLPVTIPHANNEARGAGMEINDDGEYADRDWPRPQRGLAAMISRLDSDLGVLLARLAEYGLDEKTLVIFTSDNGPHAEGGNDPDFFDSNGPLRGKKRDLYEGGIRVPFIARWPGKIPAGKVSSLVAYHGDLMATCGELVGSTDLPRGLDSISLVPEFLGRHDRQQQHSMLYWEFDESGFTQAVRAGSWKAIRPGRDPSNLELYDLQSDVGEERNIAADHPDIVASLSEMMAQAHVPHSHGAN